jgi:hypothetical protein
MNVKGTVAPALFWLKMLLFERAYFNNFNLSEHYVMLLSTGLCKRCPTHTVVKAFCETRQEVVEDLLANASGYFGLFQKFLQSIRDLLSNA